MKTAICLALLFALILGPERVLAQRQRIYTPPDPNATGGIIGKMPSQELSHALAMDSEREHVYRAKLSNGGTTFQFEHVPVGKYDLVLVTKDHRLYEGVRLGEDTSSLSTVLQSNLIQRISLADSFFNRYKIHRAGVEGERLLVFVERLRDQATLQQSGAALEANLRRLEVVELTQSTDDWQMIVARHLYREGEPRQPAMPFLHHVYAPDLGGIRVVSDVKQLGTLKLPSD